TWYFVPISAMSSITFILTGTIERFLLLKQHQRFIKKNSSKKHIIIVFCILLFWSIFAIPNLIYFNIDLKTKKCKILTLQSGWYPIFFTYSYLFLYCLLPSILLSIFSLLTILNLKQYNIQINYKNKRRLEQLNCDLIKILLTQSFLIILSSIPITVYRTTTIATITIRIFNK
ncbi:unnamed protein product, partial [Didymodactylos carnosus]